MRQNMQTGDARVQSFDLVEYGDALSMMGQFMLCCDVMGICVPICIQRAQHCFSCLQIQTILNKRSEFLSSAGTITSFSSETFISTQ